MKDITAQEILSNLLDGSENLDLKTHINKPKQLAGLKVVGLFLGDFNLNGSGKLLLSFIDIYLRYMVSFKRLSRREITKVLSHTIELEEKAKMTQDLG